VVRDGGEGGKIVAGRVKKGRGGGGERELGIERQRARIAEMRDSWGR